EILDARRRRDILKQVGEHLDRHPPALAVRDDVQGLAVAFFGDGNDDLVYAVFIDQVRQILRVAEDGYAENFGLLGYLTVDDADQVIPQTGRPDDPLQDHPRRI